MDSANNRTRAMYRPTLAAIARRAGVSVATVSKVLNSRHDVSPETRRRIERLLDRHGYQRRDPDRPWVALSNLIDLVMIDLDDAWAAQVLAAFESAARQAGLGIIPAVSGYVSVNDEWVRPTIARGSRGIITVFADFQPRHQRWLRDAGVPLVLVGPGLPVSASALVVPIDYRAGVAAATRHLLDLGHRRIGLIVGDRALRYNGERYRGYQDAMAEYGALERPDWIRWSTRSAESAGVAETETLMGLDEPPTAILAGTDLVAVGVYQRLAELGVSIPNDVSVVGFDDRPEARWLRPQLTTLAQPVRGIAEQAVRLLVENRVGAAPTRMTMTCSLVVRDSTAPPDGTLSGSVVLPS